MNEPKPPYNLSCLLWRDAETKMCIGHCLNYDLMDSAPSFEQAWENLKFVVKNHIEYCYTANREGLRRVANQEAWDKFFNLVKNNPGKLRVEKLDLDLREPSLPGHEVEFWVLGQVQDAGCPSNVQADQGTLFVN